MSEDEFLSQLTDRLISPAEMAELMGVTVDDVRGWILEGTIDVESDEAGVQWVRISESRHESGDGAASISGGFTYYRHDVDADVVAAARNRRRDAEYRALDVGGVDAGALAVALSRRLAPILPPRVAFRFGDADHIALLASFAQDATDPERVRSVALQALDHLQDHIAETTALPWPPGGSDPLPDPHAVLDGDRIRLFYGSADDPVLELDPIALADVVYPAGT